MSDYLSLPDLASDRVGGVVVCANDEFFAPRHRLIHAAAPVWKEGLYDDTGKWMDGWETRRRRDPGSDWCIVRLGLPGIVRGVVVDTSYFTGNYPESASLDASDVDGTPDEAALLAATWTEILPRVTLAGDTQNQFRVENDRRWTHVRLHIHPDGGVARLRIHGEVVPDWDALRRAGGWIDLGAIANGGRVVAQSDAFYGNAGQMLHAGRATHMGDGWETRRRRGPGNDWAIVQLGAAGVLRRIIVDTEHFKGNAPGACSVEGCHDEVLTSASRWIPVLERSPLSPHTRHVFEAEILAHDALTHARLSIYPDGGVARLRVFGELASR